jgi:excisionase family DNA binding protein
LAEITTDMPLAMLTPQKAASQARVSRGTIMNAIKNGSLVAFRDNKNRWQIRPEELSKWLSSRTGNIPDNATQFVISEKPSSDENSIRLAVLEAELKNKDLRISDLERDRDSWKQQAQELARRDHQPEKVPTRRRWWPFG